MSATLDAAGVAALAGITTHDVMGMHVARGFKPSADRRPDLPQPVMARPLDTGPRWDADVAAQWAAEWLRVGAETQAAIEAAEQAARDAHAERNHQLAELVPAEVYGVPAFSAATLPRRAADRPVRYLYVGQEPLLYDHGRLLGPRYFVEGFALDGDGFRQSVLLRGVNVVPEDYDLASTLNSAAVRLGTPEIRRFAALYAQADPKLWRETASDLQALMVARLTRRVFGEIGWRSTSAHLGLDGKAKDEGERNVFKKIERADELDATEDLDRLARARMLATMLGIDLDADLRA